MIRKFDHPSYKVLVTGNSGTGKSTLWHRLITRTPAQWKFVYDHEGVFEGRWKIPAMRSWPELEAKFLKKGWVVYDPIHDFLDPSSRIPDPAGKKKEVTGAQRGFRFFCEWVFAMCKEVGGRKLVCVDELQMLVDTNKTPGSLLALCETGRQYQIDIIVISQAPNRIHNAVRNTFTDVYTFSHVDEAAIGYLADNAFDPVEVRTLGAHEYIHRNLRTGEVARGREKI